ncbi:hypothetical protein ACFQL4_03970 [Halosimplex aquaticum]
MATGHPRPGGDGRAREDDRADGGDGRSGRAERDAGEAVNREVGVPADWEAAIGSNSAPTIWLNEPETMAAM